MSNATQMVVAAKSVVSQFKVPPSALTPAKVVSLKPVVTRVGMIKVLNGKYVPTELYEIVRSQVHKEMPNVRLGQLYDLNDICAANFWHDLKTNVRRRQAGEAFAHMVATGLFPFEFIQYKKSVTKYYRLIEQK